MKDGRCPISNGRVGLRWWLSCWLLFFGCSAVSPGQSDRASGATNASDPDLPSGDAQDRAPENFTGCLELSSQAENVSAPADIIWIIDNSGSMSDEARIVQENMNIFVSKISSSAVDSRVIVLTAQGFVNIPAPLGNDPARFLFVNQDVDSFLPLATTVSAFERFRPFLRPSAMTHFVLLSDFNSMVAPEEFLSNMRGLLGHDFVFHAIASESVNGRACSGPNGFAMGIGDRYYALAQMTQGQTFSICTSDWTRLFDTLATAVTTSATLPCAYELPSPPEGKVLDREKVNVRITIDNQGPKTLARIKDPARCGSEQAWYYDDNTNPTKIHLCQAACSVQTLGVSTQLDILLGCATERIIVD